MKTQQQRVIEVGMMLFPMLGVIHGFMLYLALYAGSTSTTLEINTPVLFACMVIGSVLQDLSPLPDHNGGFGMPPARWQKWGFTTEPYYDDYREPDAEDRWTIPLLGFLSARRRSTEDGEKE